MTRETHHTRCTTSLSFSSAAPPTFAPPPPLCCVVVSFVYVTMPLSAQSSSSSVARDVLLVRALGTLPDTSAAIYLGIEFWTSCDYDATLERSLVSLRAGDQANLTPLSASPVPSPSLASFRSVYEAWKAGTLTRSMLADVSTSAYIFGFFSTSFGLSDRSPLRSLWQVSSIGSTAGSSSIIPLRTRSTLSVTFAKAPGPFADQGRCFIRGVLSARCVILSVFPCQQCFPFCPSIIDLAGSGGL